MANDISLSSQWFYTSTGGFLELSMSNSYIFTDGQSNDILLHTDTPNQNLLFGTDCNMTSAMRIEQSQIECCRNILSHSNVFIGSNPPNYCESLVCAQGNALFLSNIYIMNDVIIGASNNTHRLAMVGKSNTQLSTSLGPNVSYYFNSISDPVYQHLNWNHDNSFQCYDAYFSNNDWISSSSNGNFIVAKQVGQLTFLTACNIAPGSSASNSLQIGISINSNSFVGIGTNSNVIHRLTLQGLESNMQGPHIAAYLTNDNQNPVYQHLNWTHDDITQAYDVYMNCNNDWVSSSSNGNFILSKQAGHLMFQTACGVAPGVSASNSLQVGICINSNSFLGIGTNNIDHCVTIRGVEQDIQGPHIAVYVDTDIKNPVFQHVNWCHDGITQAYDVYQTSNDWISSSSNGNFVISKQCGHLTILAASNVHPGTSASNSLAIAFSVNSNTFIGFGTDEQVSHRFTIMGPPSDKHGPHIVAYVSSDVVHPVFQQLNWDHDNISQSFDLYFTSNMDWVSSSSNGNFLINKSGGQFNILSTNNITPGASASNSLKVALSISSRDSYVGIGTTTPAYQLDISGSTIVRRDMYVNQSFSISNSLGNVTMNTVQNTLNVQGNIYVCGGMEVSREGTSYINGTGALSSDTSYWMNNSGNLYTMNSSVGIGTKSPSEQLDVNGNINLSGNILFSNSPYISSFKSNIGINLNTPWYTLHVSGSIHANGEITSLSDIREKKNLMKLSNSLHNICKLNGYSYNLIHEDANKKKHIGLVAQEVLHSLPELVEYDEENDKYSVKYCNMIAVLVEAIKELREEVQALKSERAGLEN